MTAVQKLDMHWIDASEQLPDDAERVLLFTPYKVFGDDHACVGNRESLTTCTTRINRQQVRLFTHWMPLPPNPGQG